MTPSASSVLVTTVRWQMAVTRGVWFGPDAYLAGVGHRIRTRDFYRPRMISSGSSFRDRRLGRARPRDAHHLHVAGTISERDHDRLLPLRELGV